MAAQLHGDQVHGVTGIWARVLSRIAPELQERRNRVRLGDKPLDELQTNKRRTVRLGVVREF
jgi:hypothetical protein